MCAAPYDTAQLHRAIQAVTDVGCDAPQQVVLEGDGDVLDGLRALCGTAWSYAGDGACGLDGAKAIARLGL